MLELINPFDMLTQRTIAVFQRFLSGLMQIQFFGMNGLTTALNPALYYNKLYEANLPRQVLDAVGNGTHFLPIPMTLALYEGHAVAEAKGLRYADESDQQMGATYLICAMAVAIRFCEQMDWDHRSMFEDDMQKVIASLGEDGFSYQSGVIRHSETGEAIIPVALDGRPRRAVIPMRGPVLQGETIAAVPATASDSMDQDSAVPHSHSHFLRNAGWVGVFVTIVGILVTVFVKEVHDSILYWITRIFR
jgi:hypothetical protein